MSYKTSVKSLRYGITADWYYKGIGSVKNSLVAEKIGQYVGNIITFVIPPTPKKVRTRGVSIKKAPSQPGVQGRTVVMETSNKLIILVYYYLNFTELSEEQSYTLEKNFNYIIFYTAKELGNSQIFFCNYFDFFFYTKLSRTKGSFALRQYIKKFFKSRPNSGFAIEIGKKKLEAIKMINAGVSAFKRQQYVKRSLQPLAAAFFFNDCDTDLVVRVIAFELQTLRVFHKRFINFIRSFFKVWMKPWSEPIRIVQGIRLEIKGRITLFRRQIRRASSRHFRFGIVKKSNLKTEAISSKAVAFNRYGVISVNIHCEIKKRFSERWEDKNVFSPFQFFRLIEMAETNNYFFDKKKINNFTDEKRIAIINKISNFNRWQTNLNCIKSGLNKAPNSVWLIRPISYLIEQKNEVINSSDRLFERRNRSINKFFKKKIWLHHAVISFHLKNSVLSVFIKTLRLE